MTNKINIGIVGYGNLGRAVEKALMNNEDLKLEAIFTRRSVKNIISDSKLLHISEIKNYIGIIDVMILCGGSATDLPQQSAEIAKYFNVIDSFDTHAKIEEHFIGVDGVSKENEKTLTLEERFAHLEQIVARMEDADVSLDEAFELYKKGLDEVKSANDMVQGMEKAMLVLNSDGQLEEF